MPPGEAPPTARGSFLAQFCLSVKWGTQTRSHHDIPGIAESDLVMSFFPLRPSVRPFVRGTELLLSSE